MIYPSEFDDAQLHNDIAQGMAADPAAASPAQIVDQIVHRARAGAGLDFDVLESIIGTNDLVEINYLSRGFMAARTVCRLNVPQQAGDGSAFATGFLVGPRLLLTNAHVLPTIDDARRATAEFSYELGSDGRLQRTHLFRLAPQDGFITSPQGVLDFTLVAIEGVSDDGTAIDAFGFLRLDPRTGKIDVGQYVTIIQHPDGGTKRIALRENKLVKLGDGADARRDNFLWYSSDTAPGSSGAPVTNDAWQVVCLHHSGVPDRVDVGGETHWVLTNGTTAPPEVARRLPAAQVKWLANEGIRTSRLIADAQRQIDADGTLRAPLIAAWLDDANGVAPFPGTMAGQSVVGPVIGGAATAGPAPLMDAVADVAPEAQAVPRRNRRPARYFDGRTGYDPDFLPITLALPTLGARALRFGAPAPVAGADDNVLRYTHFSILFNGDPARRIPFFTAVNIDGKGWTNLARGTDRWFYDPRIPEELQSGDELYGREPVPSGNYFDRGHLVRRLDPVWGDIREAAQANDDTFYWTNCSPQYKGFNEGKNLWAGLEDFILFNTDEEDVRASVFTGPLFRDDDEEHRGILIPQFFWKVVAVADAQGALSSSGYLVSQQQYALGIPFEQLPVGPNSQRSGQNFQVPVSKIVADTGIDFAPAIIAADVYTGPANGRSIRSESDIEHPRR